jgi:hypothetical protein
MNAKDPGMRSLLEFNWRDCDDDASYVILDDEREPN